MMENPGYSIFGGGSIHLDGIRTSDLEDEEEEEENRRREEEEENRGREEEIQDLLANAFDDLEDEESYANQPGHYAVVSRQVHGGPVNEGAEYPERHQGMPHAQDVDVNKETGYRDLQSSITEYGQRGNHGLDGGSDRSLDDGVTNEHLSRSSSQDSVVPWSDDSQDDNSNRFRPFVGHETANHHFTGQEDFSRTPLQGSLEINRAIEYNSEVSSYVGKEAYLADNYKSNSVGEGNAKELRNQYKEADTSHDQLKLLYEVRGRELDKQMTELSKVKFESSRNIRVMQHQINLLTSDNESKIASNNQLQILLSENEERIKNLVNDVKELQIKLKATQDENQTIHFELETAESTISSLECQISELKAADSLARNQQLHKDFLQKLKQGNQEEKELLMAKLQESQKEGEASQQEVKRLRDELKTLRATYDEVLVQKTETVTKLTVTIETVRKQYEELLQAHDSHLILEMQLQVKNLESHKKVLENKVCTLEMDLTKAKEDLQEFDTAVKLGILSEIVPGEDSMAQLGIKRTLNYDDTQTGSSEKKGSNGKFTEAQERLKIRDELKKSLLINKAKRNEISRLRDENHEKHDQIKKAQCDLKNAHIEIKELRGNLMKLQMEHTEHQLREDIQLTNDQTNVIAIKAENIALRQESTLLYSSVRELNHSFKELSDLIQNWKNNLSDMNSVGDFVGVIDRCDKLLKHTESCRKSAANIERFNDLLSQIREENHKLHKGQAVWEKRMCDIQIRVKVLEKMIVTVVSDQGRTSEYNHTCNTLQKLLEDLSLLMKAVREENSEAHHKSLDLQDQLTACQFELERLKKNTGDMKEERDALQLEIGRLEKEKDKEKDAALESCRNTYLKFHEEAVHELEKKIKAEYENISDNLKREIARLAEQLNSTKEMYIRICQEKDDIEDELKKQMKEPEELQKVQSRDQSGEIPTSIPNSGVGVDSQSMGKADKDLEIESPSLKESYKEEKKMMVQRENIQIRYKQLFEEELKVVHQESRRSIEEIEKKCSALEELNSILKDKCKRLEDELSEVKENINVRDTSLKECESWRLIQERQQKRFDEEKQEIKMQYENLILELKNKYTSAESSKLLEDKLKEQEKELKLLEDQMKEQEIHIITITNELKRIEESARIKDHESEQEVQKLTDMIQNLESDVKERKEENNNTRATFQKYTQELKENQVLLDEKLQKTTEEVVMLRETKVKYIALKQKFANFQMKSKEQIAHYKEELTRLTAEYAAAKETLLKRVEAYVEEVKSKCILCIDSIISTLKGLEELQLTLDGTLTELQQLSKELKNFNLQLL